ncbi:hypothetical protein, partial [Acrocarpospora phusangensis]|uniref:hypothetical protein n=1 Tax=Acrocarpospora phusangensis TaxID=1070424 RepID=UPI001952774C
GPSTQARAQAPRAKLPQVSLIGTREQIESMRAAAERTYTVVSKSNLIPRRDEADRYTLYLTVQL